MPIIVYVILAIIAAILFFVIMGNRSGKTIQSVIGPIFGSDARNAMFRGIQRVAAAVKITHGPKGRTVIIESQYWYPTSTNDGITVGKQIYGKNKYENIGAAIVKEAAAKTNNAVGDQTTTTVVLTEWIVKEWLPYIKKWVNPFTLVKELSKAISKVVTFIDDIADDVTTRSQIKDVATISAQDEEVGEMIADIMTEKGHDCVITVEDGMNAGLEKEVVSGMQFPSGYVSSYFVTNTGKMEAELLEPFILITDKKIVNLRHMLHLLEDMAENKRTSILIIAEDFADDALFPLVTNKQKGILRVVCVKAPQFGNMKKEMLQDIATVCGATLISDEGGVSMASATLSMMGNASRVIVTKDKTTIIGGEGGPTVDERIAALTTEMENSTEEYEKDQLRIRIAKLKGGIAVIKVWAATDTEMRNRKYKIEDALNATRAAVEEWVVAGGGIAFMRASDELDHKPNQEESYEAYIARIIIRKAILYPMHQIISNAGFDSNKVVRNIAQRNKDHYGFNYGFNAKTGEYGYLPSLGVIDSAKGLRVALENAGSAASTVLTTEVVIAKEFTPQQ